MLAMVRGIGPKDEIEAMMAAQMAAVHMTTMTFARRLAHVDNILQQDSAERAFNKLARTFAVQVEALKRYRTGGEQGHGAARYGQRGRTGDRGISFATGRRPWGMPEKARDSPMHRLPDWRLTLPLAQSCRRCGARTRGGVNARRQRCQMADAECMADPSTGPRTLEGLERMRRANTRHGNYSEKSRRRLIQAVRKLVREARQTVEKT